MSGLQNFLTPFSHLVFANRDKVILLLGLVLAWFTVWLLVTRWQNERLHRDLTAAKSAGSGGSAGGRRYATNTPVVEEAPVESAGSLPPVKGGRSYARNLGTALQKAGMPPQIYSPPSPAGWAPNTMPTQQPSPNMGQPPYAPQNVPWAAPAAPQGAPWGGYPSGPGRGAPGPAPTPAPFYQPQPASQAPMSQPIAPPPGVPGPFAPPVGSPFGPPAFPAVTSGPPAPPSFAPPATPGMPAAPPSFAGGAPAAEPPAAEPSAGDGGRRGKPKRRRFNFNVLENLEKIVTPKQSEPAPTTGWTPPVPGSPATWTPPVPAPAAPAASAPAFASAPAPAASVQPAPPVEATPVEEEKPAEAESLPLAFGPSEEEPETESAEERELASAQTTAELEEPVASEAEAPVVEPEPQPEPEPKRDARRSMRDMLFGEEAVAAPAPVPAPEPVAAELEPEPEPEPVAAEQPWAEETITPEPVPATTESDPWRPWNATPEPESEPQPEVVAAAAPDEGPAADVPETTAAADGPSAGTIVIIEDDPVAANYYATLFRGNGYQVEVANDGVSGVDVCTRVQPQVILLDVMMPRQNGILVLQTLRASDETKNTPVVVMSNFSEPTLIKRAVQLGALEYVIKTQVEGPALLSALPRWMNHEKAFAAA
jgi:CheY-like chemotaxis protein